MMVKIMFNIICGLNGYLFFILNYFMMYLFGVVNYVQHT